MKIDKVKRKKRGSILGAIGFFLFFLAIILVCGLAAAYMYRDHLLLEYVREQDPKKFGLEVLAVDSIVTRPIGQVSVELRGLVLKTSKTSPLIRADRVTLATPKNLFDLYRMTLFPSPLVIKAQLIGLKVQAFSEAHDEPPTEGANATAPGSPHGLPFPLDLEAEIRDSEVAFGSEANPHAFKKVTGIARLSAVPGPTTINTKLSGQLAMGFEVKGQRLPIRTDWELEAAPLISDPMNLTVLIKTLTVSTLGMTLKSKGSIKLPEQAFQIEASGTTPDLSVVPLDKAEGDALGLEGRLKGQADASIKASGAFTTAVIVEGFVTLKHGVLPFALSRETPHRYSLNGPVNLDFEVPFKVAYDFAKKKIDSLDIQLATIKADLSGATVRAQDLLNKPASMPLVISGQVTAEGETIDVSELDLRFSNLTASAKGQVSLDAKRTSKLDLALTVPSLAGWPMVLPVLGTLEGSATKGASDINKSKGALAVKAKVEASLGAAFTGTQKITDDLKVAVEQFEATDIQFPVNMRKESEKKIVSGLFEGSINASGTLDIAHDGSSSWNLKRAQGTTDFKNLQLQWDDLFNKSAGQDMHVAFSVASKTPAHEMAFKIDKLDVRLRDSTMNLTGSVAREKSGDIALNNAVTIKAALSQMYELVPSLRSFRAKIPSGTFGVTTTVDGIYNLKDGLAQSPLATNGRISLKAPKALFLDTESKPAVAGKNAAPAEATEIPALKWPVFAKSKQILDVQIDSITLKASEAKGLAILGTFAGGSFKGTVTVANLFGGPFKITTFEIDGLSRKNSADTKLSAAGTFQGLNLSLAGEFMNPAWKTLVAGLAAGTFKLSALPLSKDSFADTAAADGTLTVKQGALSTVSLDQLVNQKLAEYPIIAKLTGAKPKVATKGVNLNLGTDYSYSKGRLTLKNFKAISPEKNELQLNGWLQKDLTADLRGVAHLADTPIGGSFRQANSDGAGRLVVPIHISGPLKEPNLTIAEDALREMTDKTVQLETNKIKKTVKDKAVDAIKEELKKRGLGF